MPWKPAAQIKCHRSGKTVYGADPQIKCGGMIFLKAHFTCAKTGVKLHEGNAVAKDGDVYHKSHVPKDKHTSTGLDAPELQRLKQQSMRQSKVAYTAAYESEKGKYEQTGEVDLATKGIMSAQNQASKAAYQQETVVDSAIVPKKKAAPPPPVEEPQQEEEVQQEEPQQEEEYQQEEEVQPEEEPQQEEEQEQEQEAEPPQEEEEVATEGDGLRWVTQYDYAAADGDEVSFTEGDIIINASVVDEGWMTGTVERTGESGMLPSNYVEQEE